MGRSTADKSVRGRDHRVRLGIRSNGQKCDRRAASLCGILFCVEISSFCL